MPGSAVIRRFKTGDYDVIRTTAGAYVKGRYESGGTSSFSIEASIVPMSGRELEALPEGELGVETRALYTTTELKTRTPTTDADQVEVNGNLWKVIRVEPWPSYYRAIITRQETP